MKFSIIVPVYNVEKYVGSCLESILKQDYTNFEVIIVNDGSCDGSEEIIEQYIQVDARFVQYKKTNGGLSDARNYGVKKATGDYLIFVDSDDTIHPSLLSTLNQIIEKDKAPDLIRYQLVLRYDENSQERLCPGKQFHNQRGFEAFKELIQESFFEPAWLYAYRKKFYNRYHFRFEKGKYHEDFGLLPYVVLKAKTVSAINFYGYYYLIRKDSITTSQDQSKRKKRVYDVLDLYDLLKVTITNDKDLTLEEKKFVYSYLANALLKKGKDLDPNELNSYIRELKKRQIALDLQETSFLHRIKRWLVQHFMKFYILYLGK